MFTSLFADFVRTVEYSGLTMLVNSTPLIPEQTQNICITLVQRRPNVFDVGPALYKCYTNVLCLLGNDL